MAMVPHHRPGNPFVSDINGMFVGKSIYVFGRVHQGADRFAINLFCGPNTSDDIALHINPRFPAEQIVRNTRTDGSWGPEEREGRGFPFKPGQLFGVKITCHADGYEIFANQYRVYADYRHRVPFHSVSHVGVNQDCDILHVCSGIEGVDVPAYIATEPKPGAVEIPFHNIREHSVVVIGRPTNAGGGFSFNFVNGNGNKNHFHFNPRLNEGQIVRNTSDGSWGREERDLEVMPFPFAKDTPFQVKITVHRRKYVVEINGVVAFQYQKRLKSLKTIRNIRFDGDVQVDSVTFY